MRVADAMSHLEPLVGVGYGEHADARGIDCVGESLQRAAHLLFGNDEDLLGPTG